MTDYPIKSPRKLIEVALPLDAINKACAREKSIRHGHPSTLHLWWARRPLAAARAVIFAQLVNDPGYQQGGGFKYGKNKKEAAIERKREAHIEMQRAMAKQAEAERERRAKVIGAEGEFQAASRLAEAAEIMQRQPIAIQLRYLQTLREIASENNSTTAAHSGDRAGAGGVVAATVTRLRAVISRR